MRLAKSSLAGLLLEDGEEELAALLACSDLPEVLDTAADAQGLHELGLDDELLESLLPAHESSTAISGRTPDDARYLEQTISERWADLVRSWTGDRPAEQ